MWGPSPAWLTRLLLDESDETEAARLLSQLVAQHLVRVRARVGVRARGRARARARGRVRVRVRVKG